MFDFIKDLFPDKSKGGVEANPSDLPSNTTGLSINPSSQSKSKYRVASCQSSGKERTHNEDTLFTLNSLLNGLDSPISFGIFLVADGMGGHQSGEIASHLAAKATSQYLMEEIYRGYIYDQRNYSDLDLHRILKESIEQTQKLIIQQVPGGGTTLTAAVVLGHQLYFMHVGDCRLYKIDLNGNLILETKDHSLIKRLIDLGEISASDAVNHPQRNVLYRALGQADPFEPDIGEFLLEKGEQFMICSDGLWGVVKEKKMLEIINNYDLTIEQKACKLVEAANQAGGPDNISLVLVEHVE